MWDIIKGALKMLFKAAVVGLRIAAMPAYALVWATTVIFPESDNAKLVHVVSLVVLMFVNFPVFLLTGLITFIIGDIDCTKKESYYA